MIREENKIIKGARILANEGPLEFSRATGRYFFRNISPSKKATIVGSWNKTNNRIKYGESPEPGEIIRVNPDNINYVTPVSEETDVNNEDSATVSNCIFDIPYGYFEPELRIGKIIPGDWDRKEVEFKDLFIYQSFEDHFLRGIPWEKTEYLSRVNMFFDNRQKFKNTHSFEEFKNDRLAFYDELYVDIKEGNYVDQSDLRDGSIFNEITVNIGRDGDIFFNSGGAHRLSMAKIADIDSVPVLPVAYHEMLFESQ